MEPFFVACTIWQFFLIVQKLLGLVHNTEYHYLVRHKQNLKKRGFTTFEEYRKQYKTDKEVSGLLRCGDLETLDDEIVDLATFTETPIYSCCNAAVALKTSLAVILLISTVLEA